MKQENIKTHVGFNQDLIRREGNEKIEPYIFKDAVSSWPAIGKWSPEYLKEHHGDFSSNVFCNLPNSGVPFKFLAKDFEREMSVSELVQKMQQGDACYMAQADLCLLDGLANDFDLSNMVGQKSSKEVFVRMWLGQNTCSGLHFDIVDNFLTQIYGIKKVFLVAPSDSKNLYHFPDTYTKSQVDLINVDTQKFPNLDSVTVYEGTMEPGDILFIPKGWWHCLQAPETSISISCWFGKRLSNIFCLKQMCYGGPKAFMTFFKDFILYGILGRPFERRLFSGGSSGTMAYGHLMKKFQKRANDLQ